jgi:hypothetical protein
MNFHPDFPKVLITSHQVYDHSTFSITSISRSDSAVYRKPNKFKECTSETTNLVARVVSLVYFHVDQPGNSSKAPCVLITCCILYQPRVSVTLAQSPLKASVLPRL